VRNVAGFREFGDILRPEDWTTFAQMGTEGSTSPGSPAPVTTLSPWRSEGVSAPDSLDSSPNGDWDSSHRLRPYPRCPVTATTFCLVGIGMYGLLSIADFVLTFALIQTSGGLAYESNPVAAACLERHGWDGLAVFKIGGVVAFVGSVGLLTRYRPKVAAGLVVIGCAVLLGVTNYSHSMLGEVRRERAERHHLYRSVMTEAHDERLVAWIPTRY